MKNPYPIDRAIDGPLLGSFTEPTFAGVPSFMRRRLTKDLTNVDIAVWGIPFDMGTSFRPGTRFGPAAIRRMTALFDGDPQYPSGKDPFDHLAVIDYGDCWFEYGRLDEAAGLIFAQTQTILNAGVHLISLGGDHFITLPLLRAHAAKYGPLALLQFDAHQDTWADNGERISHGSFVTRAIREGLIDPTRSTQIGIRTIAPTTYGIDVITSDTCHAQSAQQLAARIIDRAQNAPIYLSFDVDGVDPAYTPGTGTPVPGGLTSIQALNILWELQSLNWCGMDIVEVSPPYDHADITSLFAASVVQRYLQILAGKKG